MPKVGSKHFSYDAAGYKAAAKERRRLKAKRKKKPSKKAM